MPGTVDRTCSSCGEALAAPSRFCPGCGSVLEAPGPAATRTLHQGAAGQRPAGHDAGGDGTATVRDVSGGAPSPRPGRRAATSDSLDHGRFVPGTLLLGRYRVQGLLGRGGMGEVYRADDLKLEQIVALKFLPPDLSRDAGRLARFHNEVRLARQVSHANVVRVYDIGEWEGQAFLSMEYVDGEDLSTLLRRIGRLPADKATEVGRQICAGLAAAHDRGVVHRDLKPGNIMIDGRGRARITDFGLASLAEAGDDAPRAGTPAYMAPEQIHGGEVGPRADLFSLGLVLYELYTGRRAYRGESWEELNRSRQTGPPSPSSIVDGLDPAVERAIQRCLEEDPRQRPASALAVAASLPGGDPLAMALAAGETPSPEMVAAAGETGGLRPALVGASLAAIAVTLFIAARLGTGHTITDIARPPRPPEVLHDRAVEILKQVGYPEPAVDSHASFGWHRTYLEDIAKNDTSPQRWQALARPIPPALYYYYRQSPSILTPANIRGRVGETDPAPIRPGMVQVVLTAEGRLWKLDAVPPQNDPEPGSEPAPAMDWGPVFAAAGLDPAAFRPAEPRWVPSEFADTRQAWEGVTPGAPEIPVRVEGASYRGRAVAFNLVWPWTKPLRATPFQLGRGEAISQRIVLSFILSTLVACGVLARRNLRAGRGDRRGAFRLAAFILLLSVLRGVGAHHFTVIPDEWGLIVRLIAAGLFNGMQAWLLYIAIEPFVRRHWPDTMVSWTRLLAGRTSDALVGRDVLLGVAFGSLEFLLDRATPLLPIWLGRPAPMPDVWELDALMGLREWVAPAGEAILGGVEQALVVLVLLAGSRALLRSTWLAAWLVALVGWTVYVLSAWERIGALALTPTAFMIAILIGVALRHGLLALCALIVTQNLLGTFGVTLDWGAWYARPGILALLLVAVIAGVAARAALAGRSLFDLRFAEA
ncbi:MAG TPA: protein kinase [Candidatus Polarisedimenticolia bacterium]|nr:protein kinase [Candidatus Polarisedimenticolia bacterium]